MTPRLRVRSRCALTFAAVLLAAPAAYASDESPQEPAPSLAGHPAGEGRARPGRVETATTEPVPVPVPVPVDREAVGAVPRREAPASRTPVPSPPPAAARRPAEQAVDGPAEQHVSALTLGSGLALMGLGIGYFGARLRRR